MYIKNKYILNTLRGIVFLLMVIVVSNNKTMAATRTDTFTYNDWSTPSAAILSAVSPLFGGGPTIGLRTPGTNNFNSTLNDPYNSDTSTAATYEVGVVTITPSYICSDQTPIAINLGGFNVTRDKVNDNVNGDGNIDKYLYGGVFGLLGYNSSNANVIATAQGGSAAMSQNPTTSPSTNTFDYNPYTISGATFAEVLPDTPFILGLGIGSHEPYGSTSSYKTTTPTITLTYDDAGCTRRNNSIPVVSNASSTISTTTANGTIVINGSVLGASDSDNDSLTYAIVSGNDNNYFSINSTTGSITTNSTNIPTGTYTLTVKVSDGHGGEATSVVTITVTNNTVTTVTTTSTLPSTGLGLAGLATILSVSLATYFVLRARGEF